MESEIQRVIENINFLVDGLNRSAGPYDVTWMYKRKDSTYVFTYGSEHIGKVILKDALMYLHLLESAYWRNCKQEEANTPKKILYKQLTMKKNS